MKHRAIVEVINMYSGCLPSHCAENMEILTLQKTIQLYLTAYFKLLSAQERNIVLILKISFLLLRFEKKSEFSKKLSDMKKLKDMQVLYVQPSGAMKENSVYKTKRLANIKVLPIWLIYNINTRSDIKLS